MITDLPTHTDYKQTGISLLNLAWESTLTLALSLDDAKEHASVPIAENEYWIASQSQLSTAIALVQQATEFLLKSRIAVVSPYLLINGTPREWPKDCNTKDMPFADFYAINAQELIKVHDTVAAARLPVDMKESFERMRRLRNSIMHTVDKRLNVEVKQVIVAILEISNWFTGPNKWIDTRREHIEDSQDSIAYESFDQGLTYSFAREVMKVVEILSPAESKSLLGFDKKQRRFICYMCASDCANFDLQPNLALLVPNTPTSVTLHCFLCAKDYPVVREDCDEKDCEGNVLGAEDRCCLTCYN